MKMPDKLYWYIKEEALELARNGFHRYIKKDNISYEYMEEKTARLKGYTKESGWEKLIPKKD